MFEELKLNGIEYSCDEITALQAINIANYGDTRGEAAITDLIKAAYKRLDGEDIDVWYLTAAQRYFMVAAYLCMADNGGDFAPQSYSLSNGCLTDYIRPFSSLDFKQFESNSVEIEGQVYRFKPLLGWHFDIVERVVHYISENQDHELHALNKTNLYELGCISIQMRIADEENPPDEMGETVDIMRMIEGRMIALMRHKDSFFSKVVLAYYASSRFNDVFTLGFCDDGLCVLPRDEESEVGLSPVMFRAISCLSEATARMG